MFDIIKRPYIIIHFRTKLMILNINTNKLYELIKFDNK
jgi:hypothetical protein